MKIRCFFRQKNILCLQIEKFEMWEGVLTLWRQSDVIKNVTYFGINGKRQLHSFNVH